MYSLNQDERLIFIGGSPRSGTTLVQNILDSHPDIFGGPEFLHLPDIIHLREKLHGSISRGWIDLFCSCEDVDGYIRSFIENLLLPLADKQRSKFISEKTPENILVFSELLKLFPQAHFIHVIRDPRAIVFSMQQVRNRAINKGFIPPAFTATISASIKYAERCINAGLTASKNAPDKVLTVVYERLVIDPEKETKKICKFLGFEWNSQMIFPANKEHLGEKAITSKSNEIWYDKKMY
ncbi:sulfotransferase [Candidatus Kuenenia sp.]|uniref:sulfotransferase family protein n=1 Tax=Candidatus Kuenenia sp. TaxID=2499824 RepID=UPI00321FEC18